MPSLKIWGQDAAAAANPADALTLQPSDATAERGWFRSVDEYAGHRGLGAQVQGVTKVTPGEPIPDSLSRRSFLQLLGGGLGVAGLQGCFKPPAGHILPYGKLAANLIPGEPLHYATGVEIDGVVTPLLVTCFDGRPIKVEGNPDHPENLGSTGVFEQALLEQLYDSNRVQAVSERGQVRSDDSLRRGIQEELRKLVATQGEGLRLLVPPTSSPFLHERRARVLEKFPKAKIVEYSALGIEATAGTEAGFGQALLPRYDLTKADTVLSLDSDFLWTQPYGQRLAREFTARRTATAPHLQPGQDTWAQEQQRREYNSVPMNRLYVAEANFSITGMMADHRLRVRSSDVGNLGLAILRAVTVQRPVAGLSVPAVDPGPHANFVQAVAKDLLRSAGRSVVFVGPRQPPEVQALGHLLNLALGNLGQTVSFTQPAARHARIEVGNEGLRQLAADIDQQKVDVLLVTAQNPAFGAPADLDLARRIAAVPFSVYLADYADQTAEKARWVLPAAHPLETWGDAVAADGSHVVLQPLLAPLFDGKSEADLIGLLIAEASAPHELLYSAWHKRVAPGVPLFDDTWAGLLRKGFTIADAQPVTLPVLGNAASDALNKIAQQHATADLELGLYPSYQVHDGRYARTGQLLELPDPVTKLTWTNAALVSPKTADKLGIASNDVVELTLRGRSIQVPTIVLPGHADDTVSVALGFGQVSPLDNERWSSFLAPSAAGPNPEGKLAGANAYALRHSDAPWFTTGLKVQKTGGTRELALSQEHWTMEGRELAIEVPAALVGTTEHLAGEHSTNEPIPSFYDPVKPEGFKWAMAIDLARCTGCSACVMACQTENNIPIVGEEQVKRGREMHWLRLDRYFTGDLDDPGAITQPVACVHCENAPCEYVCPVNATVHSDEGLNEMIYNRCVGTRYCSNNCPYHVRRFNYLNYSYGNKTDVEKMAVNPEVTVRSRGVMEKCTYCVQRIERGRIGARVQGRDLRDGDIKTACQTACPTQAISFGTLSDPNSKVSQQRQDPRSYQLLKEVGTRPRTTHLVRVKNKNPELS